MKSIDTEKLELHFNSFMPDSHDKAGLFLCTSGSADVWVNNRKYHIEAGTLCMVSPLIASYLYARSADFDGIYILTELEVLYAVIRPNVDTILHLRLRNHPCICLDEQGIRLIQERKALLDTKQRAMEEAESEEEKSLIRQMMQLLVQETFLEIIATYFRMKLVEPHPLEKSEAVIYNFIYSLHAHFKKERSVSFYADEAHLSASYFTSLVKQKTERTPSEWIVAITIAHIKLQLSKTSKSIKEIADELNFPEQFTFRKYFKQYVGVPPTQYRLQMLKKAEG